jgi:riboflavin-specific deaminase-like protein
MSLFNQPKRRPAEPAAVGPEFLWSLLLKLRSLIKTLDLLPRVFGLGLDAHGKPGLVAANDPAALIAIDCEGSWEANVPVTASSAELFDLYLPMCLARRTCPLTVAHLGQSLDGRIATEGGASCYVTGAENLTHLHRMRALCDAIVVGASTVEYDNPQLTTRRVPGPNPVRVVIDPYRRLDESFRLFQDQASSTLLVCCEELADRAGLGHTQIIGVPHDGQRLNLPTLLKELHTRGLFGIFVEGGGVTVSGFLEQGLLDHLQVTVAPLIIGSGRPSIILPTIQDLSQGLRPRHRRYPMGEDMLFDCRLRG